MEPSATPVFIFELDVDKPDHHACALTTTGTKIYDNPLPQVEEALREIFTTMQVHGSVLMVVDEPNTIGALPIVVAHDCGCAVGYLPGVVMRKAANLYPGRSRTDRRDDFIIADTARTTPQTLRTVERDDETLSALKMLARFDDNIGKDATSTKKPLRGVLTQIHPALERAFVGEILSRGLVLDLLIHYGSPTKLGAAS